nr:estrogen sulfotransferase-like [Leptinotarsa decemlineata]
MMAKNRKIFKELPFEVKDIENEVYVQTGIPDLPQFRGILVGPKKYFLHPSYRECGLDIYNFEARPDDVWLMGYHRSGTTLHAEMIWLIANNLDFQKAAEEVIDFRFRHLDGRINDALLQFHEKIDKVAFSAELQELTNKYKENIEEYDTGKRRFIKSHLPISLNPPHIFDVGAKVIYIARNPKDVIVSMYHLSCFLFEDLSDAKFEEFFHVFKSNMILYQPYFEHVKEAWARRNDDNFLFIFFEDTIKDKPKSFRKIADFLGVDLTQQDIDSLEDHLKFENFKANKSVNLEHFVEMGIATKNTSFIRKGKLGGWREYFVGDMARQVDEWIEENLKDCDLRFRNDQ